MLSNFFFKKSFNFSGKGCKVASWVGGGRAFPSKMGACYGESRVAVRVPQKWGEVQFGVVQFGGRCSLGGGGATVFKCNTV